MPHAMATIAEGGVGTHISDMQAGVNNIDYVRRKCMKKHVNTVSRWVTLLISLSMLLTACLGGASTSIPESQQATSSQQTASSEQTAPAGEASDIKLGIVAPSLFDAFHGHCGSSAHTDSSPECHGGNGIGCVNPCH